MVEPLVDKQYMLEKFPGKGGWTYAAIPDILPDKHAHFGWVRVKGSIDGFEIKNYNLMPMGNGCLFLPVKAEIRKKIGKQEGDMVHVILSPDSAPVEIPNELLLCLKEDSSIFEAFNKFPEGEKKYMIDWIYSAKKDSTKVERIAKSIKVLAEGKRFFNNKS
jgi:hypothetical protein